MPKRSFAQHLGVWDRLVASLERNADGAVLRNYQELYQQLKEAMDQAREAKKRQLQLRAATQQATRDLEAAIAKANDASVRLNSAVVGTYGRKSEKLAEFGLRPWRPRRRKAKTQSPEAKESAASTRAKPRKTR
jgi:hypothetical protein